MNNNEQTINLDSDVFNSLKQDFNLILRNTLNNMLLKEGETAEVKVSLKIKLITDTVSDPLGIECGADREVVIPRFEHKVSSVMQYKTDKAGFVGDFDHEMVWDKDAVAFIMRPIETPQMDINDYFSQYNITEEEEEQQ